MTASAKRAAIYTRVSSDEQAQEGTSLDVQRHRGEAYCLAQGGASRACSPTPVSAAPKRTALR